MYAKNNLSAGFRSPGLVVVALAVALALGVGCASSGSAKQKKMGPLTAMDRARAESERTPVDQRRARSHYKVGVDHLRNGRDALAIRELRSAQELDPGDAWIQLGLAEAYRLKGLPAESEAHLIQALSIDPEFQEAHLNLAALYIQLERYDEALPHTRSLLADPTFPAPWQALTNQGFAFYRLGQLSEARESLEMAVEYHPTYWQALLNLGILDAEEGDSQTALTRFEEVLELGPGPMAESEAHYRSGEIYVSQGNLELALDHLEASRTSWPSGPWGKRSQDYLKRLR